MRRAMMGFVNVAVAVLSLLSVAQSAPVTNCESLIRPIEIQGRDQLLGRWTLIAESTNIAGSKLLTKMFVESSWVKNTAANESDAIDVFQSQKMFGRCYSLKSTVTLKNSTLYLLQPVNASEVLLNTGCPDCIVAYSKYTIGSGTYSGLQLISRRNKVTAAELEEFTKQVECLSLPSAAIMDPEKGFCPEGNSQETEITDLTSFVNDMGSEFLNLFDRIINSEGGVNTLFKMISDSVTEAKQY